MEYKYTKNKDRIIFSSYLNKLGVVDLMMYIMPSIPWEEYKYEGKNNILCYDTEKDKEIYEDKDIVAVSNIEGDGRPYFYFGGCIYNLYKTMPGREDKKNYMDPTGDIDVRLNLPKIISVEGRNDIEFMSNHSHNIKESTGLLTNLTDNYLRWLCDKIYDIFLKIKKKLVNELVEYKFMSDEYIYYNKNIDNKIYFVIVQEYKMIKIQVECKVKGMKNPDHLFECVVPEDDFKESLDMGNRNFNKLCEKYENIYIQTFDGLIDGNISSITDRTVLYNDNDFRHKLYNHIARLRYLNLIYPYENKVLDSVKRLLCFLMKENNFKIYNYTKHSDTKHSDEYFFQTMINNFVEALKQDTNRRNILFRYNNKYEQIKYEELLFKFDIKKRSRKYFRFTKKNRNVTNLSHHHKTKKKGGKKVRFNINK